MWIELPGTQGHVAYPHLADNPLARLGPLLTALDGMELDQGTEWFQPSNLELTEVSGGSSACNVIPDSARARLNIRFNDLQRGADLVEQVRLIAQSHAPGSTVEARISGEAFLTQPGPLTRIVSEAVEAETGITAALSTGGGTSDARFLSQLCPVVEFGLTNATMHKVDEAVSLADLHRLRAIYARIIRAALA
jgi:succinyl-diaminopimelate desuccinylase